MGVGPRRHSLLAVPFVAAARAIRGWLAIANGIQSAPLRWLAKLLLLACFPFALRFIFWPLVVWVVENMFGLARHERLQAFAGHPVGSATTRLRAAGTGVAQHVVAVGHSIDWILILGIAAAAVLLFGLLAHTQHGRQRALAAEGGAKGARLAKPTRTHHAAASAYLLAGVLAGAAATGFSHGTWAIRAAVALGALVVAGGVAWVSAAVEPLSGEPVWRAAGRLAARNERLAVGGVAIAGAALIVGAAGLRWFGGDLPLAVGLAALMGRQWSDGRRLVELEREWAGTIASAVGAEHVSWVAVGERDLEHPHIDARITGDVLADELGRRAETLRVNLGESWVVNHDGPNRMLHVRPAPQLPPVVEPLPVRETEPHDPWYLGVDQDGMEVEYDVAAGAHMLIAGATRSGKSVCTYGLLAHIASMGRKALLLVADPNDTTVAPWERHVFWATNDITPAEPIAMLKWLREQMDARKPLLRELRSDKISEFTEELPLIVIVIDEAANYMRSSDKQLAEQFNSELLAVVSQGAKFGIRLVLITQRPDSTILPTAVRSQLSARISFRVEDAQTATMVFPEIEPEALLGLDGGTGWFATPGEPRRLFRGVFNADPWALADSIPATGIHHGGPPPAPSPASSKKSSGKRSAAPRQTQRPAESAPAPQPPTVPGRPPRRPHAWLHPDQAPKPSAPPSPPSHEPHAPQTQRRSAGEPVLVEEWEPPLREPEPEEWDGEEWDGAVEEFGRLEPGGSADRGGQPGDETARNGGGGYRQRGVGSKEEIRR